VKPRMIVPVFFPYIIYDISDHYGTSYHLISKLN